MPRFLLTVCALMVISACGYKTKSHPHHPQGELVYITHLDQASRFENTLRNELTSHQYTLTDSRKDADFQIKIRRKDKRLLKTNYQASDETRVFPVRVEVDYDLEQKNLPVIYQQTAFAELDLTVPADQTPYTGRQLSDAYQSLYQEIVEKMIEQIQQAK